MANKVPSIWDPLFTLWENSAKLSGKTYGISLIFALGLSIPLLIVLTPIAVYNHYRKRQQTTQEPDFIRRMK